MTADQPAPLDLGAIRARIASLPPVDPEHHFASSATITHGRCVCGAEVCYDEMDAHAASPVTCEVTVYHPTHGIQTVVMPEDVALRLLTGWPFLPDADRHGG